MNAQPESFYPDAGILIADLGQPHWPGWQILVAALLVTLAMIAVQPAGADTFLRPARGGSRTQVVRVVRGNGSRDLTNGVAK